MRTPYKSRVDRVDHFFGDILHHDRKRMREAINWKKGPSKKEIDEVCWEIYPKYTRLKGFSGDGEKRCYI